MQFRLLDDNLVESPARPGLLVTESHGAPGMREMRLPRFFFHVSDSVVVPDEEGVVLADLAAARIEAITVAGAMLQDHAAEFWSSGEWKVIVTGEDRVVLFSICCQALAAPWPPLVYHPRRGPIALHRVKTE